MQLRYSLPISIGVAFIVSGCGALGLGGNWSKAQKQEFTEILQQDSYSSLCNLRPMLMQYKQTKDEKILSQILVKYTENLANSCIDQKSFKVAMAARKAQHVKSYYEFYNQDVNPAAIMEQLKKGATIKSILAPYVPPVPQFYPLVNAYNNAISPIQKHKIKLNIERTKLMKPEGWNTYVMINVPEYKFRFFQDGVKSLEFNVIVGRPTWQTPIFSSEMKYITVHPTWNVPDNIARKEEIPHIIKDPSYLRRHNMVVKRDYAPDSPTVNPKSVPWKEYLTPKWAHRELPYKIIEQASSRNALGRVKFMFPNRFSVYMHDTNNKKLFQYQQRAFSHGCIRLQKPLKLLGYVSTYYTKQSFDSVKDILNNKKTGYVGLKQKIPVHIVYLTAYVEDGMVHFFNDIYGFDKMQQLKAPIQLVKRAKQ